MALTESHLKPSSDVYLDVLPVGGCDITKKNNVLPKECTEDNFMVAVTLESRKQLEEIKEEQIKCITEIKAGELEILEMKRLLREDKIMELSTAECRHWEDMQMASQCVSKLSRTDIWTTKLMEDDDIFKVTVTPEQSRQESNEMLAKMCLKVVSQIWSKKELVDKAGIVVRKSFSAPSEGLHSECFINFCKDPPDFYKSQTNCSLSTLVIGNVGSGKSCLINSILGRKVAKDSSSVYGETTGISEYQGDIKVHKKSCLVTIADTPGLQNPWKNNDLILQDIQTHYHEKAVVLACFNVTLGRVTADDIATIKSLTESLGVNMWRKAVFVLTFSNQLLSLRDQENELLPEQFYSEKKGLWSSILFGSLRHAGVSQDDAVQVPVVLAGLGQEPLPHLKSETHWLTDLLETSYDRAQA